MARGRAAAPGIPGTAELVAMVFVTGAVAAALRWPALKARWSSRRDVNRLLLFVCGGNLCRSPMAEAIARHEIGAANLPYTVASAGVAIRVPGRPITADAATALRELGVPVPTDHSSRVLTRALCADPMAVYCMTAEQRDAVLRIAPQFADRTYTLDPDGDIEDPTKVSLDAHRTIAQRIQTAVRQRLAEHRGGYAVSAVEGG